MSSFYTRERKAENYYEITFCTEDYEKFLEVQDSCRKLMGYCKRISFLFLEQRKQLENCFYKWCEENDALKSPFNVISFLAGKDLINIDKTMDYLEEASNEDILHNT